MIASCTMVPSHYVNHRWLTKTFIQENGFKNISCDMVVILFDPKCLNFQTVTLVRYRDTCHNYIKQYTLHSSHYAGRAIWHQGKVCLYNTNDCVLFSIDMCWFWCYKWSMYWYNQWIYVFIGYVCLYPSVSRWRQDMEMFCLSSVKGKANVDLLLTGPCEQISVKCHWKWRYFHSRTCL